MVSDVDAGRASGFVHHGGIDTTATGFRTGIPSLVIPHIVDQFIGGQKVTKLISRAQLMPEVMTDAFIQ